MKKSVRRKRLHDFEAEWIMCGSIYEVCKRVWQDYCDFADIEYQKLISHSVTRWLSLYPMLPRMLQMYPASYSHFMSIDKPTVVLKRLFENSLSELCLRQDIRSHFWLLLMSKFRILRSSKHHLLRLYSVSPLWRQGFIWDNQMYISS